MCSETNVKQETSPKMMRERNNFDNEEIVFVFVFVLLDNNYDSCNNISDSEINKIIFG